MRIVQIKLYTLVMGMILDSIGRYRSGLQAIWGMTMASIINHSRTYVLHEFLEVSLHSKTQLLLLLLLTLLNLIV